MKHIQTLKQKFHVILKFISRLHYRSTKTGWKGVVLLLVNKPIQKCMTGFEQNL